MNAIIAILALLAAPASKLPGAPAEEAVPIAAPFDDDAPPLLDEDPMPPADTTVQAPIGPKLPGDPVTFSRPLRRYALRAPRPIRWRFDPFLEGGTISVRDPGAPAFVGDHSLGQLGVGARIDGRVGGPVFLGGGLRYGYAESYGSAYAYDVSTSLKIHQPSLLLRLSVVMIEGVDLVAQVGGGVAFTNNSLDVTSYNDNDGFVVGSSKYGTQRRVLGAFDAKAGVSLYLPKAWLPSRGSARVTAGLDLMFGYDFRTKLRAAPRPDTAKDDIRVRGASLGDLALRGFVWSAGIFVRFM